MVELNSQKDHEVFSALSTVTDPEIGISITDLGLVYKVDVQENKAHIKMTFTSMACPMGAQIKSDVERNALRVDGIEEVDVQVVWAPPWNPREMATEDGKDLLGIE